VDEDGFLGSQRFVFPGEIDEVLRGVDKLAALGSELVVEFGSLGVGNHASVNANSGVLGAADEPFDPVLGAINVTGLDANPVCVDLGGGLYPIPRVDDKVRAGL
jgi:hypothetical protein